MPSNSTTDYSELDDAIVAAIKGGRSSFESLSVFPPVSNAARGLERASPRDMRGDRKPAWRFIDTRLQALRKRGVITFVRPGGWTYTHLGGASNSASGTAASARTTA